MREPTVPLVAMESLCENVAMMRADAFTSAADAITNGPKDIFNHEADGWRAVADALDRVHRMLCSAIETARSAP